VCVCVVAVAGCGSSGHKPSASSPAQSFVAFSECMRSHGVSNYPDPTRNGLNIAGTGINPFSPSYKDAQTTCNKTLPAAAPPHRASEQQKEQLMAISECMRSHGVTGFPDPTTSPTSSQGYSMMEGVASNLFLLVPSTIDVNSPAFEHAAKACNFQGARIPGAAPH
jgi:hypothetical protein